MAEQYTIIDPKKGTITYPNGSVQSYSSGQDPNQLIAQHNTPAPAVQSYTPPPAQQATPVQQATPAQQTITGWTATEQGQLITSLNAALRALENNPNRGSNELQNYANMLVKMPPGYRLPVNLTQAFVKYSINVPTSIVGQPVQSTVRAPTQTASTSSGTPTTIKYANGTTVRKPNETTDAEWAKLVAGYTARFGQPVSTSGGSSSQFAGATGAVGDAPLPSVNTGNPVVDNYANTVLNDIWSQYGQYFDSTSGVILPAAMDKIIAQIEQQYGPALTKWKQLAQDQYDNTISQTTGQTALQKEGLANTNTRAAEDVSTQTGRINTDLGQQMTVLGRNFQEAQREMSLQFAGNNRTFSGDRVRQEGNLGVQNQEAQRNLNQGAQRSIQDLQTQQARVGQDTGLAGRQLDLQQIGNQFNATSALNQSNQSVNDFKAQLIAARQAQVENLPLQLAGSLVNQPSFAATGNASPTITATTNAAIQPVTPTTSTTPKTSATTSASSTPATPSASKPATPTKTSPSVQAVAPAAVNKAVARQMVTPTTLAGRAAAQAAALKRSTTINRF